jgi:HKD family nuclease
MKLITSNSTLLGNLSRLIKTYPGVVFAVAWASANTPIFQQLIANPSRIKKAIIGTHFYQTHPDVLDAFVGSQNVRFILQPKGVFHPKIYLFRKHDKWEALIGSANLTSGAFTENSEAMVLISDSDGSASLLEKQIDSLIDTYWPLAISATRESALAYRTLWLQKQPDLRRLSGEYGKAKSRKLPTDSSVMSMSWEQFLTAVRAAVKRGHFFDADKRCGLLRLVRVEFLKHTDFASMELGLRQTIAGLPTAYDKRWGWFGNMQGAGYYYQAINHNDPHLSAALDEIPLQGQISRSQYEAYLREFMKAFPKGGHGIATASRLLALKRPDQFICLDSKNRHELCKDFGIKQTGMDYDRYWDEVVERIIDSPWWNAARPANDKGGYVWDGRTAMLDSFFYDPQS